MVELSGVIITYNEADRLALTLQSIKNICSEIVIVDSGSTDDTVSIAREFGCTIIHKAFEGFGEQKDFAVKSAKNDWVMVIDADEVVTDSLAKEIQDTLENPKHNGYYLPRTFVFLGRSMKGGNEEHKKYLRLFNRTKASFGLDTVHEDVLMKEGHPHWLKGKLLHYSYRDISHYFSKFNQYTSLGALEIVKNAKRPPSSAYVAIRLPISFIQYYLLKGYFRDGYQGLLWSIFSSLYPLVKYAKAKEAINGKG
jgi:glycosyltransferase involved in cell wall biosynthesis